MMCPLHFNKKGKQKSKNKTKERNVAMEYYSALKKNEILPFVTAWMNLGGVMLSEINQTENSKYHMISLIGGI